MSGPLEPRPSSGVPIRLDLGERAELPDICGRCGETVPKREVLLRLRRPVIVNGRVVTRTLTVPIGYCARCWAILRRYDPAVQAVWSGALALAAGLLIVQTLLPRSDDVLALRAWLPWAALGLIALAAVFALWANSLMTTRFPVRLVDFGAHGYTLMFDNPRVAAAFERASRPIPASGGLPEPTRLAR